MKIGLGQAEGSDTALVTDTIISTCREQIGADQPKAGLVFAGPHFDHVVMLEKICSAFPGMVLVGCTTSGDYTSAYGFSDDSISLIVICASELEFGAGLGRNLSLDYRCAVEVAYSMARGTLQDDPSLCLAFPRSRCYARAASRLSQYKAGSGMSGFRRSRREAPDRQHGDLPVLQP